MVNQLGHANRVTLKMLKTALSEEEQENFKRINTQIVLIRRKSGHRRVCRL